MLFGVGTLLYWSFTTLHELIFFLEFWAHSINCFTNCLALHVQRLQVHALYFFRRTLFAFATRREVITFLSNEIWKFLSHFPIVVLDIRIPNFFLVVWIGNVHNSHSVAVQF